MKRLLLEKLWQPFWKATKLLAEITAALAVMVLIIAVLFSPFWLAAWLNSFWPLFLSVIDIWFLGVVMTNDND
jgi:hypothetical protein